MTHCPLRSIRIACEESGGNLAVLRRGGVCSSEVDAGPGSINTQSIVNRLQQKLLQLLTPGCFDDPEMEVFVVCRKVFVCVRTTALLFEREDTGKRGDFLGGCVLGG